MATAIQASSDKRWRRERSPAYCAQRRLFLRAACVDLALMALALPQRCMASAAGPNLKVGVLSHHEFLNRLSSLCARANCEQFVINFKSLLQSTAAGCVVEDATWVIPSQAYASFFFPRDSFWVLAALNDRPLSQFAVELFEADQAKNPDGHIATALYRDGSHPINRDRDEESTMMYVLHSYV